jgi:hypothetical protein
MVQAFHRGLRTLDAESDFYVLDPRIDKFPAFVPTRFRQQAWAELLEGMQLVAVEGLKG